MIGVINIDLNTDSKKDKGALLIGITPLNRKSLVRSNLQNTMISLGVRKEASSLKNMEKNHNKSTLTWGSSSESNLRTSEDIKAKV